VAEEKMLGITTVEEKNGTNITSAAGRFARRATALIRVEKFFFLYIFLIFISLQLIYKHTDQYYTLKRVRVAGNPKKRVRW